MTELDPGHKAAIELAFIKAWQQLWQPYWQEAVFEPALYSRFDTRNVYLFQGEWGKLDQDIEPTDDGKYFDVVTCSTCGALVPVDEEIVTHDNWHKKHGE